MACLLMLVGHAVRAQMPPPDSLDKLLLYVMDFSGPIFFFVSGMNVVTFIERHDREPGFTAGRFYVAAAAALFFLGFTYNLNRVSPVMDIFQGVAVCTVVVFFLLRSRLPVWAHWLIVAGAYGFYLWAFRWPVETAPQFAAFRAARAAIPPGSDLFAPAIGPALRELFRAAGPLPRLTMIHFGFLPWLPFFYVGALCYRSATRAGARLWPWWAVFGAMFAIGPFVGGRIFGRGTSWLDQIFLPGFVDLMLRGIPSYVLTTLGGAGLLYLAARRTYPGAGAFQRRPTRWLAARVELLGRESLLFLIVHWWVISTVFLLTHWWDAAAAARGWPMLPTLPWPRALMVIVGTMVFVPIFARWRDRGARRPGYAGRCGWFLAASFVLTLIALRVARRAEVALYISYGASFAFAFMYPSVRAALRRRYTTP